MAKSKTYYWLKLNKGFFGNPEIKILRRVAGGDTYTLIYLEMMLLSLENAGYLYFEGIGDNMADELAAVLDEKVEDVSFLLIYLQKKNLIEVNESQDEFYLSAIEEMIGSETESARKMRRFRKKEPNKKIEDRSHCDDNVTECDTDIELDIEKEIEKEKKNTDPIEQSSNLSILNEFENIWKQYPKKTNKKKAAEYFKKKVKSQKTLDRFLEGFNNYLAYIKLNDLYSPQELFRWIRDDRYEDIYDLKAKPKQNNNSVRTETLPEWAKEDYRNSETKKEFLTPEEAEKKAKELGLL